MFTVLTHHFAKRKDGSYEVWNPGDNKASEIIPAAYVEYRVAMLHFQEIDCLVDGVVQQAPRRKSFKELVLELSGAVGLPRKPALVDLW